MGEPTDRRRGLSLLDQLVALVLLGTASLGLGGSTDITRSGVAREEARFRMHGLGADVLAALGDLDPRELEDQVLPELGVPVGDVIERLTRLRPAFELNRSGIRVGGEELRVECRATRGEGLRGHLSTLAVDLSWEWGQARGDLRLARVRRRESAPGSRS